MVGLTGDPYRRRCRLHHGFENNQIGHASSRHFVPTGDDANGRTPPGIEYPHGPLACRAVVWDVSKTLYWVCLRHLTTDAFDPGSPVYR